jgi:hypothetical protein
MDTVRLRASQCPHCGKRLDALSTLDGPVPDHPTEGDLMVCIGCGEALRFDAKLLLRKITAAELADLHPETAAEFHATQTAVRAFLDAELKD